ncbi:unnamed protein product [Effrenium voratum]|nr:unnamed protein product [Effrenium voratum]
MDLTIHVQACGTTAAFALCLDVLPHQITSMAHLMSILQMCSTYAQSRPTQAEAHQQLKQHMDRLNFIQKKILLQKKRRNSAGNNGRQMRPMPAILASEGLVDSDEESERKSNGKDRRRHEDSSSSSGLFESDSARPILKVKQKAQTAPAEESDELLRMQTPSPGGQPEGSTASVSHQEVTESECSGEGLESFEQISAPAEAPRLLEEHTRPFSPPSPARTQSRRSAPALSGSSEDEKKHQAILSAVNLP